jgi:hypothetical protein
VASNPPPDLTVAPLDGPPRAVEQLLTLFDLCFVALDPFTHESAWILETAGRILTTFDQADVRVAFVCTGTPDECRLFLGPWAKDVLTFADPDRQVVKAFGLERLPALVHLGIDGTVVGASEGWHPAEWKAITENLAKRMAWTTPVIPVPGDPAPFEGTPALG